MMAKKKPVKKKTVVKKKEAKKKAKPSSSSCEQPGAGFSGGPFWQAAAGAHLPALGALQVGKWPQRGGPVQRPAG